MSNSKTVTYRPEIDGLRAVAVLAVLINHLNHKILPGGYLGVDVFFVISGYVVTASLINRLNEDLRIFLVGFYQRRFRRLQPALLLTFVITIIVFNVFVSPSESIFQASNRTGIASLFGVSNIYLLRQATDYFAVNSQFNPFLHTWSLGVEEQFYLVWPIIIAGCSRLSLSSICFKPSLRWSILVLGTVSLIVYLAFSLKGDIDSAFFLPTARLWELAAGSYLAAGKDISKSSLDYSLKLPSKALPFMLPLLIFTFFAPDTIKIVPTLLCVAFTLLLIGNVQNSTSTFKLLANPVAQAIGKKSYSLYLWHWPVIVTARWTIGVGVWSLVPILILITIFTLLSYRVESYFRAANPSRLLIYNPLVAYPSLSVFAAAGAFILQGALQGRIFAGRPDINFTPVTDRQISGTRINTVNCFREPTSPISNSSRFSDCLYKPFARRPTIFFLGDSHADAITAIGSQLVAQGKYNVSFVSRGGCPSPYFKPWANDRHKLERYKLCDEHYRFVISKVFSLVSSGDYVVIVSNFPGYLKGLTQEDYPKAFASLDMQLNKLARSLKNKHASLIVFKSLPFFSSRPDHTQPITICKEEWFRPQKAIPDTCKPFYISRQRLLAELEPVNKIFSLAQKSNENVYLYDPFPYLCPSQKINCSTHDGSVLLFTDGNHLSNSGAMSILPGLMKLLDSV